MYLVATTVPFSTHKNPKKAKDKDTQNIVWMKAFLMVIALFLLLKRPRSRINAITRTSPKVRYVIWSTDMQLNYGMQKYSLWIRLQAMFAA
jgi:hypothetical protein